MTARTTNRHLVLALLAGGTLIVAGCSSSPAANPEPPTSVVAPGKAPVQCGEQPPRRCLDDASMPADGRRMGAGRDGEESRQRGQEVPDRRGLCQPIRINGAGHHRRQRPGCRSRGERFVGGDRRQRKAGCELCGP